MKKTPNSKAKQAKKPPALITLCKCTSIHSRKWLHSIIWQSIIITL